MQLFRKIRNYVIGLSIIVDIFVVFSFMFNAMGATISNKIIDFSWYYIFISVFLIFVWFYASDNKEKYPTMEMIVNNIIAIIFMAPWISFIVISIFN